MQHGATPRRIRELSKLVGADRSTLARWKTFWQEHFPLTKFWSVARARLVPVFEIAAFPLSLVEAFVCSQDDGIGLAKLLRFLSPITTTKGTEIKLFEGRFPPAENAHQRF